MEDHELRELLFRQEALEMFVRVFARNLVGMDKLTGEQIESILEDLEEEAATEPRLKFHIESIERWFSRSGGKPSEIAQALVERARLRTVLFGSKS